MWKTLEAAVGKAETKRVMSRALSPSRTGTNRRMYCEEAIKRLKLLRVLTEMASGPNPALDEGWERRVLEPNQPNPPPSVLYASRFNGTSWSSAQALDNPGSETGQMVPYGLGFDNAGFATVISHKVENGTITAQYRNRFEIP